MQRVDKYCFVISPFGEQTSDIRKRSDILAKYLIHPVCAELGLTCERAIDMVEPGLISRRLVRKLIDSDVVVADLTGHNPNVFYELGIRHATAKPTIHIMEKGERLPFDVFDVSTIFVDHRDVSSIEESKEALRKSIETCTTATQVENPVSSAVADRMPIFLGAGKSTHDLVTQFGEMSARIMHELESLRDERSVLFSKLLSSPASAHPQRADLSGEWASNFGKVRMKELRDDLFAEYAFIGDELIGEITGKVTDDQVTFGWRWKDQSISGFGYWQRLGPDVLEGRWFFAHEVSRSYMDIIESPGLLHRLSSSIGRNWRLLREES